MGHVDKWETWNKLDKWYKCAGRNKEMVAVLLQGSYGENGTNQKNGTGGTKRTKRQMGQ